MNTPTLMVSLEMLEEMSNGDKDFIREMINIYQEDTPVYMKELEIAVSNDNWDEISKVAHKMKSSTRVLGAEVLVTSLSKLEAIAQEENKAEVAKTEFIFIKERVDLILEQLETLKP